MTKPYEPTEAEIEALRMEMDGAMYLFSVYTDFPGAARWILQRFVRREEAEGRKHLDLLLEDNARLRAELRGQRCDGSGYLRGVEDQNVLMCPGCPACKPDATPKADRCEHDWTSSSSGTPVCLKCNSDGSRDREVVSEAEQSTPGSLIHDEIDNAMCLVTPESMSLLEHHCSDADFATIGKLRDESYAAGYQAGRDDAVRLNIKQVSHVVELGPETLRALVEPIVLAILQLQYTQHPRQYSPVELADAMLTHLREKETK